MVLVQVVAHYDKPHNHHICHCVYINIIIFFIITIIKSSLSSTFDKNQYHYHHQSQFNAASPHCTAFFTLFNSTSLCSVLLLSILCFVQHILIFFLDFCLFFSLCDVAQIACDQSVLLLAGPRLRGPRGRMRGKAAKQQI